MPKQLLHFVDIDTVELRLSDPALPDAMLDELYRFGQILFSEMLSRGSEIDRKLTNMLGWSTATLAFLMFHDRIGAVGTTLRLLEAGAIVCAFISVLLCAWTLKTKMWPAPSEMDWFKPEILDAVVLKKYHIVSLLNTHQHHAKLTATKAAKLRYVEWLLLAASSVIAVLGISRLLAA